MPSVVRKVVVYDRLFIVLETRTLTTVLSDYLCFFRLVERGLWDALERYVYSLSMSEVGRVMEKHRRLSLTIIEELKKSIYNANISPYIITM